MPLWNPYIYCGNPLMANMQTAIYYPLNILYYILAPILAWKIGMFITFILMPFFVYMLAREHEVSEEGSYISALTFSFGYYTIVKAVELADINAIMWMPAVLLFTKRYAQKRKLFDLFFATITLSLSVLSGHPQVFSYVFFIFTVYYFFFSMGKRIKFSTIFAGGALIGGGLLLLTFIQTLPTLEFIALCRRMIGFDYAVSRAGYMRGEHILEMFFPFSKAFFNNNVKFLNWAVFVEVTIPALLLFIIAAFGMKKFWQKIMFLLVFVFALFIALLGNMPFYQTIYKYLLPFQTITYAGKITVLVLFVIAMLSGMGLDTLFGLGREKIRKLSATLTLVLFTLSVAALVMFFNAVSIIKMYKMYFDPLMTLDKTVETVESYSEFMRGLAGFLCLAWAFVLIIALKGADKINKGVAAILIIGLVLINIFIFWNDNRNYYVKDDRLLKKTALALLLNKDKDLLNKRILSTFLMNGRDAKDIPSDEAESVFYRNKDSLYPNVPMAYRFLNADGFDSLLIGDFYKFKQQLSGLEKPWENDAFRLLSVKYIASKAFAESKMLKYMAKGQTYLFEYLKPLDIAFFVSAGAEKIFTDEPQIYENEMFKKPFDPEHKILLASRHKLAYSGLEAKAQGAKAKLTTVLINSNEWLVKAMTSEAGFVVLTDNYYPGWEVYVNGIKKEILKTDWTFKAVYVEKGDNSIRFVYKPAIFWIAAGFSLLGLLIGIIYGLVFLVKKKKN